MGSDEEYLDNLLKSVSADSGERKAMTEEEIAALFSGAETSNTEENTDISIDQVFSDIEVDTQEDDILALDDSGLDFGAEIEGDYDFVLDELNGAKEESYEPNLVETEISLEENEFAVEEPETFVQDSMANQLDDDSAFLKQEEVQALLESDADLFALSEEHSDLVDLENLDLDEELGADILEEIPLIVEEVPDTEEIEQSDMLDIASMFGTEEDLTEGATYDTSGFFDDTEPSEEKFDPFADMSDIDELLKAVNWVEKTEEEKGDEAVEDFAITEDATQESDLTDGVYLEDMDQITSEELDNLLPKEEGELEHVDALADDFDLSTLSESEDSDIAELGALLQMADGESNFDLSGGLEDEIPSGNEILQMDEEDPKEAKARKKAEKAEAKARKKSERAAKKNGFFSKIMTALLEEEEEPVKKQPTEEVVEIDENQDLLETLDKEEKEKKKKEKKEKPKKEKASKPKKEKKVKPKKEKVVDMEPPTKIRKNSIIIVVGFAASLLVLVLLGNAIVEPLISKRNAKEAFAEQQYEECYQLFAGQNLSKEEQLMLDHASVVLKIQRRIWRYEEYIDIRDRLNALDSLFDAIANYDDWYQEALNCGARAEVESAYADILGILDMYGVSESQAQRIANLDDVEYTRAVTALAEGESLDEIFGLEENSGELPDLLPGEIN